MIKLRKMLHNKAYKLLRYRNNSCMKINCLHMALQVMKIQSTINAWTICHDTWGRSYMHIPLPVCFNSYFIHSSLYRYTVLMRYSNPISNFYSVKEKMFIEGSYLNCEIKRLINWDLHQPKLNYMVSRNYFLLLHRIIFFNIQMQIDTNKLIKYDL